jgi:transcriptional regulator with XRE-family HTH domain
MPAKHKLVSHAARKTRELMVANLERRIRDVYPKLSPTAAYERIGQDTGNSLSSFQRIMSGKTGPSIDTLSDIAHNLGCSIAELFAPVKEDLPAARDGAASQSLQRRRSAP